MNEVLVAIIAGVVTALGSLIGIYWKARKDLEMAYDTDLRNQRIHVYIRIVEMSSAIGKIFTP